VRHNTGGEGTEYRGGLSPGAPARHNTGRGEGVDTEGVTGADAEDEVGSGMLYLPDVFGLALEGLKTEFARGLTVALLGAYLSLLTTFFGLPGAQPSQKQRNNALTLAHA